MDTVHIDINWFPPHRRLCSDRNHCASLGWKPAVVLSNYLMCVCVWDYCNHSNTLPHPHKLCSVLHWKSSFGCFISAGPRHPCKPDFCVNQGVLHLCLCHPGSLAHFLEVLIINFPWCLSDPVWLICPQRAHSFGKLEGDHGGVSHSTGVSHCRGPWILLWIPLIWSCRCTFAPQVNSNMQKSILSNPEKLNILRWKRAEERNN